MNGFSRLRKGDKVTVALSLAGLTTREEETVLSNRKGVIEIDNGPGNDPTRFDHEGYLLVGGDRDYAMRLELCRLPLRTAEGVLLGNRMHIPVELPGPSRIPSRDPGFGAITDSLCGRFNGIIYDREWVEWHWPNKPMCSYCERKREALGA